MPNLQLEYRLIPGQRAPVPALSTLRVFYFVSYAAVGVYLPFFPPWLEAQGFRGSQMSALASLVPLGSLTMPLLLGLLADKLALRGPLIAIASGLAALGMTLLGVLASAEGGVSLGMATVCMLLFALFRAPAVGLGDVLAMESGAHYGRLRLFGSLGFLCIAVLAGPFLEHTSPALVPWLIAGSLWLGALVALVLPQSTGRHGRAPLSDAKLLLQQPGFRLLALTVLLVFASHSSYDLCASLRVRDLGAGSGYIGVFWAIGTLSEVFMMFASARAIERIGPGKTLTFAALVGALRWAVLSGSPTLGFLLVLQPLHAITFGLMWLSAVSVLKREVGEKGMATGQGLLATAAALGSTSGYWLWGATYAESGAPRVFGLASLIALLAACAAVPLIRWRAPAETPDAGC
jgi:PPP family 3-phenylpropionic acid transporter